MIHDQLATPAFGYGDATHDIADLVLVGVLTGAWPDFEADVADGLALERARPGAVPDDEVEAAVVDFRRGRRLISGAETATWLSERGLRLADVRAVLRRNALRARPGRADRAEPDARLVPVLWPEAVCAGILTACADELRAWHTAADAVEVDDAANDVPDCDAVVALAPLSTAEVRGRTSALASMRAAYARFRATAVTEREIEARLAAHRLDWTVVSGVAVTLPTEGAARELRLRVTHDRDPLGRVVDELGIAPTPREVELADARSDLRADLLAAAPGDVVGPWSDDDGWHVLEVAGRRETDGASDETMRQRARDELVKEHLERLGAGKGAVLAAL